MMIIGLTGSIAMGKTTAARMFAAVGVPVFDSDDIVHEIYSTGGPAVEDIGRLVPQAVKHGFVDRRKLSLAIQAAPDLLKQIEAIVHPRVRSAQAEFLSAAAAAGAPFVILDIPLLFETNRQRDVDKIIVVSCPDDTQRARAMAREGMTEAKFASIMARQVPDTDKRRSADFVIDTSQTIADTKRQVTSLLERLLLLTEGLPNA